VLTILVDHNIEGHAMLLWGTLTAEGWPDLMALRLVTFPHVGLPYESCAIRLVEIGLDLANYLGTGRVFIP